MNGQSRETVNTRHRTKTNKTKRITPKEETNGPHKKKKIKKKKTATNTGTGRG